MKFEVNCMGNLEISLYWEEKIVLFFRILQLYGFLFLVYYEQWPTRTRLDITPLFTSSTMSWHILNQIQYYGFITGGPVVAQITWVYLIISGGFFLFFTVFGTWKLLKYRLEEVHTSVNWYRWMFWGAELCYFPLIFNLSWSANCQFTTQRAALTILPCSKQFDSVWWLMNASLVWSFLIAVGYNAVLIYIIQFSKISTQFHEASIEKKEIEYVLKINQIWKT